MSSKNRININIQPTTEVYGLFRHFTYTEGQALAEFIDNSTASYFSHEEILNKKANQHELNIIINYDSTTRSISIEDDAYGMEIENFKRAVLLGKNLNSKNQRNEFGYGLKTAATWFGDLWTVESTEYGSNNKYRIEMDINSLVVDKNPVREIEKIPSDPNEHSTTITISKLNKKLSTTKVKNQIINVLGSMYRRDLLSGKVRIKFNGITLNFNEYPILNFRNQDWKKQIDFSIHHDNKDYHIKGFVAIMNPGSYEKAGFALFRNDRVIVGGFGKTYKPKEIFGQQQSQTSLKLFGELNMDSFSVTQAKNDFAWDSELESLFIQTLKDNIPEYLEVAKMSTKDIKLESESSNKDSNYINNIELEVSSEKTDGDSNIFDNTNTEQFNSTTPSKEENTASTKPNIDINIGGVATSNENTLFEKRTIKCNEVDYEVEFVSNTKLYYFDSSNHKIQIGKNHNLIKDLNEFSINKIIKLILAFAYAESEALNHVDEDGKVSPTYHGKVFEDFLKGIE